MNKEVQNWLDSAEYDLGSAEHMQHSGRYIYTVFMCHLTLEKALKAHIQAQTGQMPPRIHDLVSLSKLSGLVFTPEMAVFIAEIGNLSVVTRYPADFQAIRLEYSRERAAIVLQKTQEFFKWIKPLI